MAKLRIKEEAKIKGINQSQLQLRAGVSAQLLNRYWNNHTRSVSLDHLERIAKALGMDDPGKLIISDREAMNSMERYQALMNPNIE